MCLSSEDDEAELAEMELFDREADPVTGCRKVPVARPHLTDEEQEQRCVCRLSPAHAHTWLPVLQSSCT